MSFLKNMFGGEKSEDLPSNAWFYLEQTPLEEISRRSFEKPIAIFKHSTRCSISRFAWNQLQRDYDIPAEKMELYFLDLLAHRSLSNQVAEDFGVRHQSPQLIVIKNGKAVYHTSHEDISAEKLQRFVN